MSTSLNPAGEWRCVEENMQWQFWYPGYAVYGVVTSMHATVDPSLFDWYWEARVTNRARMQINLPIKGAAPSLGAAQHIVEVLLWETNTIARSKAKP